MLKEKAEELNINFVGNVEGRDAFSGQLDILITDGFTGNIFLKTVEGFGKMVDYKEYGGALFLGVNKPVVKAHGSSDEKLFEYTIKQAEKFVENQAVEKLIKAFEQQEK